MGKNAAERYEESGDSGDGDVEEITIASEVSQNDGAASTSGSSNGQLECIMMTHDTRKGKTNPRTKC